MTDRDERAPIVVGVDGSRSALAALDWASAEASSLRRPLRIVHSFVRPLVRVPLGPVGAGPVDEGLRAAAERVLVHAEASVRAKVPALDVTRELVVGAATPALLSVVRDARLLVVGSRGLGGFGGLLLGSVGIAMVAHAPCPVVVVRPRVDHHSSRASKGIVVGVDGTERSAAAIEFAFETAARWKVGLTAVRAWAPPPASPSLVVPLDRVVGLERHTLAATLDAARRAFPQVAVESKLVRDTHDPSRALIAESADADLVVVGSRGRGPLASPLLGSVSQSVLEHAQCPVAVVRAHRYRPAERIASDRQHDDRHVTVAGRPS